MDVSLPSEAASCNSRGDARQREISEGSVLAYVTERIEVSTPPRELVVLSFLLNNFQKTPRIWPNLRIFSHSNPYIRSAETGETFGLSVYFLFPNGRFGHQFVDSFGVLGGEVFRFRNILGEIVELRPFFSFGDQFPFPRPRCQSTGGRPERGAWPQDFSPQEQRQELCASSSAKRKVVCSEM